MNQIYKNLATVLVVLGCSTFAYAQSVGIGTNTPDPSAKLHIEDPNRGLLVPSVSITNIAGAAPIATPAQGLLVWNNNPAVAGGNGIGFYFWNGTTWVNLSTSSGTDDQNLTNATLAGNNLTVSIENGNPVTVDLSSLVNDADFVVGNEYNTNATLSGTTLTITDGGGNQTVNLSSLVNDADFVVGNEYNTGFALSGNNLQLTDGGGTRTVNLASLRNDADFVVGNEYNTGISLSGNNLTITDGGGNQTVNLASLRNDADFVVGNEYNTGFALSGNNLQLTDGGGTRTVDLSSLRNDADFVVGNEYNTGFALSGNNLRLTDGGGTRTVDLSSLRNDADFVIGNEYNTGFALSGTNLTITDGGGGRTVNLAGLNESGRNGLRNVGNFIHLGGNLIENTVVTTGNFELDINLSGTGNFDIQDNGVNVFAVLNNGSSRFGGDVEWRDASTVGTILATLTDDTNDGRFTVRENGGISVDLDANTQFIFNEQGLDRNFRIESDGNPNMFHVDAGTNRVSVGTNATAGTFNVLGTSYHSDDIYLRDGAVNGGDVLVRIFDSNDDGIIDVYENNAMNHRIHGNGVTVFNEQGNNNADMRMESDNNANMFFLNSGTNRLSIGTANSAGTFNVQGNSYHSDDIYLRDGTVNGGDVLVRIFDSADDGIIDVYENNAMNHRIHGNGVSVFNEQGNNNADIRMESDNNANMFFLNAGNNRIGLGTGAPSEVLHVVGTGRMTTGAIVGNPPVRGAHTMVVGAASPSIQFGNNAFNRAESGRLTFEENMPNYTGNIADYCGFQIYHDGAANTLAIGSDCGTGVNVMTMERGGDVGIRTNNPTADLSVNGTANKTGGGNWAVFSDARLKKNITDFNEGLSLITQIRTVNFSYNEKMAEIWGEDERNRDRVYQGVIAQELQEIAPDMVREVQMNEGANAEDHDYVEGETTESESYLEVDPNKFTYALINAVQEQQAQIEALKKEIEALKAAQTDDRASAE